MTRRISSREARMHFAEITDRVRYTGEPVIIEKQGKPFVAVVSLGDLDRLEGGEPAESAADEFTRLARLAAEEHDEPEMTEEEIADAMKATREEVYREFYGAR
jgi:prevent-host-death family protein